MSCEEKPNDLFSAISELTPMHSFIPRTYNVATVGFGTRIRLQSEARLHWTVSSASVRDYPRQNKAGSDMRSSEASSAQGHFWKAEEYIATSRMIVISADHTITTTSPSVKSLLPLRP